MEKICENCKHYKMSIDTFPCNNCGILERPDWWEQAEVI